MLFSTESFSFLFFSEGYYNSEAIGSYKFLIYPSMTKNTIKLELRFSIKVEKPGIVKVKSHTRIINGKKVKVRSYYRCK